MSDTHTSEHEVSAEAAALAASNALVREAREAVAMVEKIYHDAGTTLADVVASARGRDLEGMIRQMMRQRPSRAEAGQASRPAQVIPGTPVEAGRPNGGEAPGPRRVKKRRTMV